MKLPWKYVSLERNVYWFRRGKGKRIKLPSNPHSPEFAEAYRDALAGVAHQRGGKKRFPAGTLGWLIAQYLESGTVKRLAPISRQTRANILNRIAEENGTVDYRRITPATIAKGREKRAEKPEAANNFVKAMRVLFKWAAELGHVKSNPAREVDKIRVKTKGYHTWTIEEIDAFEEKWPIGTRERLALDLLLYTGARREDLVKLGRSNVRNGILTFVPSKTANTTGVTVTIPMLKCLEDSIAACPSGHMVFLVTAKGKPFAAASFGNWFREICNEAGVPGAAHGLRKAAAKRAAEQGATDEQLRAIFGWTTAAQSLVYTREASRKRLGASAGTLLKPEPKEN
ncbi:MAG: tyrosine-type recombinase/integrase [Methylobacterium sp.]|nr:tyrosine-type recombinase/integrase [Methylobacterium sp.]